MVSMYEATTSKVEPAAFFDQSIIGFLLRILNGVSQNN
jgi:hypothetical protein